MNKTKEASHIIQMQGLKQTYGDFEALKGLDAQIKGGAIGLLGPNGAGKSTLLKTLLGLLPFNNGTVDILGFRLPDDVLNIRRLIGYMPETEAFHPRMQAISYVTFAGVLCGMPKDQAFSRAHEILYYVGLGEARYRRLETFSTGMKQRVKFAQALVHGPRILFLDEPTSGLDPQGREDMMNLILDVKSRGIHIIVSSHLLPDIEKTCNYVFLMNNGSIVYNGPIDKLQEDEGNTFLVETKEDMDKFKACLLKAGCNVNYQGFKLRVQTPDDQGGPFIFETARKNNFQIRHLTKSRMTLEMAFVNLLNKD